MPIIIAADDRTVAHNSNKFQATGIGPRATIACRTVPRAPGRDSAHLGRGLFIESHVDFRQPET